MAITSCHVGFYQELHAKRLLPQGGSLLEIGEANWYGDHPISDLFGGGENPTYLALANQEQLFQIAKAFYRKMFATTKVTAIDMNGTANALRLDLNLPMDTDREFDVVINNGTAEHVFNIGQVFQTIHECCKVGGVMIHDCPCVGWLDHGLFHPQPGMFFDLAATNSYEILAMQLSDIQGKKSIVVTRRETIADMARFGTLPKSAILLVALAKTNDHPFRIPWQGIYTDRLSQESREAWQAMR